jgi:hypothetical protein
VERNDQTIAITAGEAETLLAACGTSMHYFAGTYGQLKRLEAIKNKLEEFSDAARKLALSNAANSNPKEIQCPKHNGSEITELSAG